MHHEIFSGAFIFCTLAAVAGIAGIAAVLLLMLLPLSLLCVACSWTQDMAQDLGCVCARRRVCHIVAGHSALAAVAGFWYNLPPPMFFHSFFLLCFFFLPSSLVCKELKRPRGWRGLLLALYVS